MATIGQKEIDREFDKPSLENINLIPEEADLTPSRGRFGLK